LDTFNTVISTEKFHIQAIGLDVVQAIPVALILNEAITNDENLAWIRLLI
jgi:two-component sensor histidine kinase